MLDNWPIFFSDSEPVAFWLRETFPSRWVRFHSLPGSKRYPDDEGELAIVLGRQNRVLDELVGSVGSVVLLTTDYRPPPGIIEISDSGKPELRAFDMDARHWRTVLMNDPDVGFEPGNCWDVFASEWQWRPGRLDPVLRLVADNRVSNVMVVDPGCKWLFHPYDGGMDLILESPAARDRIKSAHADWLSLRPDGH